MLGQLLEYVQEHPGAGQRLIRALVVAGRRVFRVTLQVGAREVVEQPASDVRDLAAEVVQAAVALNSAVRSRFVGRPATTCPIQ